MLMPTLHSCGKGHSRSRACRKALARERVGDQVYPPPHLEQVRREQLLPLGVRQTVRPEDVLLTRALLLLLLDRWSGRRRWHLLFLLLILLLLLDLLPALEGVEDELLVGGW